MNRTKLRTTISPGVRDVLRIYFDAIALAEPAQFALWRSAGLTLTQFGTLRQLRGGSLPAGELASLLGISPTSITRILDRLENRKLIGRSRDPFDRRRLRIALLPAGTRLLAAVSVLEGTAIHRAVEDMSQDEKRRIVASLSRLVELTRSHAAVYHRPSTRRRTIAAA